MPTLFTYCLRYDDGAAPNPYWGVCTLAVCKPVIRRIAKIGDWIVGTGAVNTRIGDISGKVVCAMRVTDKKSMAEYDSFTSASLPGKIPDWQHKDPRQRLGDSIYDFSSGKPIQRTGVHSVGNMARDLGGRYALLSEHFFYFGDRAVELPPDLQPIVKQGQGHRSAKNECYFDRFVEWIHSLGYAPNTLVGKPQIDLFADNASLARHAACRCEEAEEDERIGEDGESCAG
ncbi:MAG TPA: hypothetical protein VFI02_15465 [Armatimonadota bacterium]|nr:hypothetical protein [Armatimonadota bacterium]